MIDHSLIDRHSEVLTAARKSFAEVKTQYTYAVAVELWTKGRPFHDLSEPLQQDILAMAERARLRILKANGADAP